MADVTVAQYNGGRPTAKSLSMQGDQYLGRSYSEMDCQAFVETCMKKVGINLNLPGSNAWYRRMTWVGTPEVCTRTFGVIPVGALLFILDQDGREPQKYKADGLGNASHIGIYIGRNGGAIHSSASKGCVAYSKFSGKSIRGGWNRVGLWDAFNYGPEINKILTGRSDNEVVVHMSQAIVQTENGQGVNFRAAKSQHGGYQGKIPDGTALTVLENDGTWSTVTYNGRSGYVMSRYLRTDGADGADDLSVTLPRSTAEAFYTALGKALAESGGVG